MYTRLVLYHCYKHALVILEQYCYFLWFLHWALFWGILPYPPPSPSLTIRCPLLENFFPLIFFSYEVFHTKSSQGWCMGCWGTRGFLYVAIILLERNFQLKRMKALNDLTFMRNSNKTRVGLIFTVLILTNCNTNCSTTVQYCKNMAFVRKHISLIHLETNSLLNYWFIDIDSLFYSHNTLIKKAHETSKGPLFLRLCLEMWIIIILCYKLEAAAFLSFIVKWKI